MKIARQHGGTDNDGGVDNLGEVFLPAGTVPSPTVTFVPRDCGVANAAGEPDSPRVVTIILAFEFPDCSGGCNVPIIAFGVFFIDRCDRLDNKGAVIGAYPKCDMPGSTYRIVGHFLKMETPNAPGGALNSFGTVTRTLVQ